MSDENFFEGVEFTKEEADVATGQPTPEAKVLTHAAEADVADAKRTEHAKSPYPPTPNIPGSEPQPPIKSRKLPLPKKVKPQNP